MALHVIRNVGAPNFAPPAISVHYVDTTPGNEKSYISVGTTSADDWKRVDLPGPKGDKGDTGEQGIQGIPGDPGAKGDKGDAGEQGIQGIQGEPGAKGDKGDRGDAGEQGIQGIQGEPGVKGDKGDIGDPGAKGDKGDAGEQGIQGIQGEPGAKGDKGDTGDPGATIASGVTNDSTVTGAKVSDALDWLKNNSGGAVPQTNKFYVDGGAGSDSTGDGSISKPFKTIQACLNAIGQPVTMADALRHILIFLSDAPTAVVGNNGGANQSWDGVYKENLVVPSRMITIFGNGVKIGNNVYNVDSGYGNILKEYSAARKFGVASADLRPCLTLVGLANTRDSQARLRNGIHIGGTCRTAVLKRNLDSITGDGTNKITVHVASGQFTYPITVNANYPTEPLIRIVVAGTTNYNATYDITHKIDDTTFEATRVSGTNANTGTETAGNFFESDSGGSAAVTHEAAFVNCYMQGAYTCDDGTLNGGATSVGSEILFAIGTRFYTGVEGRNITCQRWENNTVGSGVSVTAGNFVIGSRYVISAVGTTDFTAIGASANTVGVAFVATGAGSGTGTATTVMTVLSLSGMNNCSFSGAIFTNTFTYSTDDMGFMNCRWNSAMVITVANSGQTVRMDPVSYSSFVNTGSSWATNTPTVELLDKKVRWQSTVQTGTGSAQNVAHTLGVAPSVVLLSVYDINGAAAHVFSEGTHTATNIVVTVTANVKFKVIAFA